MANPNPSPSTRFKKGNPGGGKTSEQRRLEYEAAEMAAKARHKLLTVITEKMNGDDFTLEDVKEWLSSDTLKLFKDSEDRAHGTPKQTSEIAGPGGGNIPMSLKVITEIVDGD